MMHNYNRYNYDFMLERSLWINVAFILTVFNDGLDSNSLEEEVDLRIFKDTLDTLDVDDRLIYNVLVNAATSQDITINPITFEDIRSIPDMNSNAFFALFKNRLFNYAKILFEEHGTLSLGRMLTGDFEDKNIAKFQKVLHLIFTSI